MRRIPVALAVASVLAATVVSAQPAPLPPSSPTLQPASPPPAVPEPASTPTPEASPAPTPQSSPSPEPSPPPSPTPSPPSVTPAPASPAPVTQPSPSPPPEPPPEDLTRRGFYGQLALGPGFFYASTSGPDTRTFTGGSVALQVMLGGTPARGFVLGGAYLRDEIFGMSASDEVIDGDEPDLEDVGFSLDRFGVFADLFPDPTGGLHFQVFLGFGALNTRRPQGEADDPSGGFFGAAGGYEWRLGRHGHMGVLLRVNYAPLTSNETFQGEDATTVFAPALLGTATFQ